MTWQEYWLASGVSVLQSVAAVCCSVLQCVAAQSKRGKNIGWLQV